MTATDPVAPKPSRFYSRIARRLWIVIAAAVVVVAASLIVRQMVGRQPYHMVIQPDDDHAVVHFFQPGKGLISRSIRLDIPVQKRENVVLDSPSTAIPGGRIEFADTTILPGRFKIRIAETLFDVMVNRIEVDGKPIEWLDNNSL